MEEEKNNYFGGNISFALTTPTRVQVSSQYKMTSRFSLYTLQVAMRLVCQKIMSQMKP